MATPRGRSRSRRRLPLPLRRDSSPPSSPRREGGEGAALRGRGRGRPPSSSSSPEAPRPSSPSGSPAAQAGGRPKRARREGEGQQEAEEARGGAWLFEALRGGRSAVQCLVDDWLEHYKAEHEGAFLELVDLLLCSCGCKGRVTRQMLRSLTNSEIIHQLVKSFNEDSAEYPLAHSTPAWRRFGLGFCELMEVLVLRAQHCVVYDEYLMDSLIALLIGMSDSQVRAFRHTSTMAAMKLMTGLVRVAQSINLQMDKVQRQYEAERVKGPGHRALEKLEGLLEQLREFQEKQKELENLMNAIFKGVFVHRYRDLVPEIRAICIEEMGRWMQHYKTSFLTDGYLKYIGWTLHDKQGEVRLKCLRALQGLYSSPETAAHMELFTSRFKERMLSMVLDKELQVAVEAVRLLNFILQHMDDLLTDGDCENVFPLVYAAARPLASAAGAFLYSKLLPPARSSRQDESHPSTRAFLLSLLAFFIESEFHDHAAYLVDSLWDCAAAQLKDWQALTGLLLEETPLDGLDDQQESSLIMILVASMRQATDGQPPMGRTPGKKALTARERKIQAEDSLRVTQHLLPLLPQLLAKFSADAEKVALLLEIPRYLDLTFYSTGRLEKHLELLLTQLREVVEKHTRDEVLQAIFQTLHVLGHPEFPFYSRVDFACSRMADQLADKFQHEAADLLQLGPESPLCLERESMYRVAATLKRIAIFHSAHDLTPWNFFDPCVRLLQHRVDTGEIPSQVVISAMSCAHFTLLWELAHVLDPNMAVSGHLSSKAPSFRLKEKVTSFCSLCQNSLLDVESSIQEQAFLLLCDLLLIFGPQLQQTERHTLKDLVYQAEPALESQLAGFIMDHVFSGSQAEDPEQEELQIDQLHRRRNLLAGFCKLIIFGALELSAASDVFRHYSKFHSDYGDVIKETLNRTRQIDRVEWARTLLLSLQQLFTQLLLEQGLAGVDSAAFLEIRDLARRFSLLFGLHQLQNRTALVALHREGIKFAFQTATSPRPKLGLVNLPFLELLSEFSPRLLQPDKALLLSYLQKTQQDHCAFGHSQEPPWAPFIVYLRSLRPQEIPAPCFDLAGSAAKKRRVEESPECSEATLTSSSRLQTPQLTSTALREKGRPSVLLLDQSPQRYLLVEAAGAVAEEPESWAEAGESSGSDAGFLG